MKYNNIDITELDYEAIINQNKVRFSNFEFELAPTSNYSWEDVDKLVRRYKFELLSEEELQELELEIFRANYLWLKTIADKNTYIVKGYNDSDIISCLWFAHHNLLGQFKIVKFETKDERIKKSGSQISFRYFLKKYLASRFHRFFVEGTKDFKGNFLLENNIKKNISAENYDNNISIYDDKIEVKINEIELSDVNIKEELKKEIKAFFDRDIANSILIYFGLMKRNIKTAHLSYDKIEKLAKSNLWKLRYNKKIKRLFEYYKNNLE